MSKHYVLAMVRIIIRDPENDDVDDAVQRWVDGKDEPGEIEDVTVEKIEITDSK